MLQSSSSITIFQWYIFFPTKFTNQNTKLLPKIKKSHFFYCRFTIARKMRFVCTNPCCLRSPSEREFLTLLEQTSLLLILSSPKLQPAAYCNQFPRDTLNLQVLLALFLSLAHLLFAIYNNIQMLEGHDLSSEIMHHI